MKTTPRTKIDFVKSDLAIPKSRFKFSQSKINSRRQKKAAQKLFNPNPSKASSTLTPWSLDGEGTVEPSRNLAELFPGFRARMAQLNVEFENMNFPLLTEKVNLGIV